MRIASIASAAGLVLGISTLPLACATAVDDPTANFVDGGHHGGDGGPGVDVGGGDTSSPTDGARSDTTTSSLETGSGGDDTSPGFDSGSPGFDTGFPLDTGVVGFDSGIVTPDTAPPPPSDGSTTCTKDTDCAFPYNCCQILAGACGVFVGPICFPIS